MAYRTRSHRSGFSYSGFFSTGVKWLLISNITLFIIYYFAVLAGYARALPSFWTDSTGRSSALRHLAVGHLHVPARSDGFQHILFNMLTLWMFGSDLEQFWGTRRFLNYYFLCGIGAGLCVVLGEPALQQHHLDTRTIGASGAIYGLLLAFGMMFPDSDILFSFLFPIKAKYFVMIIGAIAFLSSFGGSGSGVSNVAHLGGMLFGYVYLKISYGPRQGSVCIVIKLLVPGLQTAARQDEVPGLPEEARSDRRSLGELSHASTAETSHSDTSFFWYSSLKACTPMKKLSIALRLLAFAVVS